MASKKKTRRRTGKRTSIFDYVSDIEENVSTNKYCSRSDLGNEASVESFFVIRLLADLGYKDSQIKTKESIEELTISKGGRKHEPYKPDFALVHGDLTRWFVDAKATNENVDDYVGQCSGYSIAINRRYRGEKPLQYFVITSGLIFKVYKWDEDEPTLTLKFSDFFEDNLKFIALRELLGEDVVRRGWRTLDEEKKETITLTKPSIEQVKKVFTQCHNLIWKAEKMGDPVPAFFEFVKVMFVKLWEDRRIYEDPELSLLIKKGKPLPADKVVFSKRWIEKLEPTNDNPVDTLLFRPLAQKFDESVARKDKKPIFKEKEYIRLHAGTIKEVVKRLEKHDLYGIDNDLNGRMFEAFLNATMRGRGLGQYFTPRSIVKLATKMAMPTVEILDINPSKPILERARIDKGVDACCGTGGFLIEVLALMRDQIRNKTTLTNEERKKLLDEVANNSIYGIDGASEPPLARIARINMYLHGDGGSRIYSADALDKEVPTETHEGTQQKMELEEIHDLFIDKSLKFEFVLTNPPFSMDYSQSLPREERILKHYKLISFGLEDTDKTRSSLHSSIMFIERYLDLLKPNGRLVTIIDDSVLSGKTYAFARDFIRKYFVVKAVVSLHGDAFQRSGARAKTSILYLIKKEKGNEPQPDVFMMESQYVGRDDVPRTTPESKAAQARELAEKETAEILANFKKFLKGERGSWLVPAANIKDRLDVKSCLPREKDVADEWKAKGLDVTPLMKIVTHITDIISTRDDPKKVYTFLKITYEGLPEEGEKRSGKEITYDALTPVKENDIAVSNIAVVYGSTSVVPKELEHTFVSSEFTLMRIVDKRFDPYYLWGFLRSPEVRARLLSKSTGISRHRAGWEFLRDIPVPLLDPKEQAKVAEHYKTSIQNMKNAIESKEIASRILSSALNLDNEWAVNRLRAAKPPK